MIVYFDTVRRKRPVKEGGELVKLDWAKKKVLRRLPIYPHAPAVTNDPNPRGNSRGGKGILVTKDKLFVGTYHTILVFDHDLNLERRITNNNFANIHEMCFSGDNIWVSATTIDCAVLVNQAGETLRTWWPREEPLLQNAFGLQPMEIDKNADNRLRYIHAELGTKPHHTHLNGVAAYGGSTYVLLNRLGAFLQIEPKTRVVLEDKAIKGSHSPVICADGRQLLLCSSFHKEILCFDLKRGKLLERIHLLDFAQVADLHRKYPDQPFNKSIFVRGLELIDSQRILLGISPASILEIDTRENRLLDFYQYSQDVGDAVHGLAHL